MSPPTEQLIRDYLNRLSVAARDRLGPDERRALLDRTRKVIERRADFAGRPTTMDVGKVLARLGDPAVLVDQERRRLAAIRGEPPGGAPKPSGPPQQAEITDSWEASEPSEPGVSHGFLARVLRRDPARPWRSHSDWPTAAASDNGAAEGRPAIPRITQLRPRWPSLVARDGGATPYPRPDLPVRNGTIVSAPMTPGVPGRPEAGNGTESAPNGINGTDGSNAGNGTAEFDTETADEFETPAPSPLARRTVTMIARVASGAWQQPLEATAIILLGVGGALFPPVFLLGALVALGSRLWHYRDKWVGLVLPPVMTIIAVAAGVAVGGRSHGFHDGWISLNIVSRVAAVLGAGYLAWRTGPGRRQPPAPPWHKPHRAA